MSKLFKADHSNDNQRREKFLFPWIIDKTKAEPIYLLSFSSCFVNRLITQYLQSGSSHCHLGVAILFLQQEKYEKSVFQRKPLVS